MDGNNLSGSYITISFSDDSMFEEGEKPEGIPLKRARKIGNKTRDRLESCNHYHQFEKVQVREPFL